MFKVRPNLHIHSKVSSIDNFRTGVNSSKESSDNDKSATSPINIKLESHTKQTATTTGEITIGNNNALPSSSTESSVVAVSCQTEVILIQESHSPFHDFQETYSDKVNLKPMRTMAKQQDNNEILITNHRLSCRLCEVVSSLDFG